MKTTMDSRAEIRIKTEFELTDKERFRVTVVH